MKVGLVSIVPKLGGIMRLQRYARRVTVCVVLLNYVFTFGCMSTKPFGPLPQTDTEFQLPPHEIVEKFPEIKAHQEEYVSAGFERPSFDELIQKWGPPVRTSTDMTKKIVHASHFTGLGLWWGLQPLLALSVGAWSGYSLPAKVSTWEKQNYKIDVQTTPFGESRVLYWDWSHLENGVRQPVFLHKRKLATVTLFGFDLYPQFANEFDPSDLGFRGGFHLGVGLGVKNLFTHWDTQLTLSWGTRGNYRASTRHQIQLRDIPIEAAVHYHIASKWRIGAGVTYHLNGEFRSNFRLNETVANTLGAIIQVDYMVGKKSFTGFRMEKVQFKTKSGLELSGDNLSLVNTAWFY